MSISELIAHVGVENIEVQFLHESFVSANVRKKGGVVTFATAREKVWDMAQEKRKHCCVILWLPSDKLPTHTETPG